MVSEAQVKAIQSHWNSKVKPDLQGVGNALFVKYFSANGADQAFFKKFAGVSVGSLGGNADFCAQTLKVMQYFDKIVEGLSSGNATQLMKDQIAPHKARGIEMSYLKKMLNFIPGFIAEHGGDEGAWKAACGVLISVL